jgi:hypothetical protein
MNYTINFTAQNALLTENKKFGTQLAEAASGYFSQKEREVARQGVNEVSAERRMRPGS